MASASVLAPQQHSQPSRKGKKAWRKNVDITQLQDGLDEVREQIIQGGVIAEKSSSELFIADAVGSTTIREEVIRKHKPLKADEILARRSAVPAVDTRKRPVNPNLTDGIIEPSNKRRRGVSGKDYERLRKIAYGGDTAYKDVVEKPEEATYDPWAPVEAVKAPEFSFLEEKPPTKEPKTLKHTPITLLASGKQAPAIARPEGGRSYNPSFHDWDSLLEKEGQKEVEAELKRQEEQRLEDERLALIEKAQREEELAQESAWETEWESEWEGIQSEPEEGALRKKRPARKTQADRNKIKRRKEEEQKRIQEAKMKKREQQVLQSKAFARALDKEEKERLAETLRADSDASSDEDHAVATLRRRPLGKSRLPEAPLEVVLADELQESLRLLKPEGNLLNDRFRSLMVRGKVETRKAILQPKKKKRTETEKWSYKDWKLR